MKFAVKSYLVFTSFWYRIILFLLVPLGAVTLCYFLEKPLGEGIVAVTMTIFALVFAEVISDYWLFSGIASSLTQGSEYIKASDQGMLMVRGGLIIDMVRRLIWMSAEITAVVLCGHVVWEKSLKITTAEVYEILWITLFYYTWTTGAVWIARFTASFWGIRLLSSFAAGFSWSGVVIPVIMNAMFEQFSVAVRGGITAILACLAICVSFFSVWHVMKHVKGGYYDN